MGRGTSGAALAPAIYGSAGPEDSDLVARVRSGDDRAFEVLYQRYHRRIHAYVLGMVKDHGRAEDVTQEVFLSALRRMRETEQPLAFKPWLYQIAKNGCIDAFRRSKRAEEVSYDAEEGLAPADHSKLVSSGASPDAAVAAKQDLDSLCGAFGGLSETHHEILVLRELEGLSYHEIGERMGMSRPAVESTLFRARRRLTEEYDDIVSGARCQRIQGIIVAAVETRLGTRDTRRLARHLSHCQPCRREALAAGLDRELLTRPSVRERVANKVAGVLPFPIFAKLRKDAEAAAPPPSGRTAALMQHMPMLSDHLQSGWGKAAAGAAVIVAGVGAGVGVKQATVTNTPPPAQVQSEAQSAPPKAQDSGPVTTVASSDERSVTGAGRASIKPGSEKASKPVDGVEKVASSKGGSGVSGVAPEGGSGATPAAGGTPSTPVSDDSGKGSSPAREPAPDRPAAEKQKPAAKQPPVTNTVNQTTTDAGTAVDQATDALDQTTQQVTQGLNNPVQQTTGTVNKIVGSVTGPGPVADTVKKVTDVVEQVVGGVGKTLDQTVGGVGQTLDGLTGGLKPSPGG